MKTSYKVLAALLILSAPFVRAENKPVTPQGAKAAKPNRLTGVVKVWCFGKNMSAASKVKGLFNKDAQTIVVKCGFQNMTKKPIGAVRGTLRFTTYFGEPIFNLYLEAVQPMPPGKAISMEWKLKKENFPKGGYEAFKKTPLEEMRQTWGPTVVVFTDGTTLKN